MRLAKCSVVRLLLPFLLFICWHGHVQAATQVCGNIVGEHWSKANSPYLVTCDVRVATLTIDPGVWVLFQSNCVFEVDGTLLAVGTPDQPIVFTRTNGVGGWQGIYFNYCGPESVLVFCTISNSVNSGIRILGDSVSQIQNCTVANNITSKDGGGVWVNLTGSDQALKNCLIANNSAANAGGGIYANITPPHQMDIEGCVIAGNTATNPAVSDNAGGMLVYGSTLMRNCSLRTNLGIASGSAVYSEGGELAIYNCEFSGNEGGGGLGGVVYVFADSSLIVANCSFLGNVARTPNFATGIFVFGLAKTGGITNCTFAYNNQEAVIVESGSVSVMNSIFYFNNAGSQQLYGTASVTYSDIQNGLSGQGNINFNPIFWSQSNLALVPGSPCIDAGNPDASFNDTCFPPSEGSVRNDMGAYGGPGACNWLSGTAPVVAIQPQPQQKCLGQGATFQVLAVGPPPLSYQWLFSDSPLTGQTSTNLVLTNLLSTQAGPYSVIVSNTFGSVTSAPAQLVVNDACVDLHMYAGLNITGLSGASYVLSYTMNLNPPVSWLSLATNIMPISGWFYLDMASPFSPQRFYRVKRMP